MSRKRTRHPLDVKTGRLEFSPILRATGERLDLVVDVLTFPSSKSPGFHGRTQDLKSGKWYAVYGKECDIPGCHCDAWVEELPGHPSEESMGGESDSMGLFREDAELLDEIADVAMRSRMIRGWRPNRADVADLEAIAHCSNRTLYEVLDEGVRLLLLKYKHKTEF